MKTIEGVELDAIIDTPLTLEIFHQLSGILAGIPYVKVVAVPQMGSVHFVDDHLFKVHARYIAKDILGISEEEMGKRIDELNQGFYYGKERSLFLGILALHENDKGKFFTLETVEVDDMHGEMIQQFFNMVKTRIPGSTPLYFKPANGHQEKLIKNWDANKLPRIFSYDLMEAKKFICLNSGEARGRLRYFSSREEYEKKKKSLTWYDIIAMKRVPDDIPRVSGIINTGYTTPLSHTNVLASGWQIPNCISIDFEQVILSDDLIDKWVVYNVDSNAKELFLKEVEVFEPGNPSWAQYKVHLERPKIEKLPICSLSEIRAKDRNSHGTKAANLGELFHLLAHSSQKLIGFYQISRPPRDNLLPYIQKLVHAPNIETIPQFAHDFLRSTMKVPRGISIPFSFQRLFLESHPSIQQMIGKLKMALELDAKIIDSICLDLSMMIRDADLPEWMQNEIEEKISTNLNGCTKFVVRSSSNAEDLEHFSAAGVYESYHDVLNLDDILLSIKKVWASLVSPRAVHLRKDVGISLDDCFMAVIIQEQVECELGGVMVTTNPLNPKGDFRNVYVNASSRSPVAVVNGTDTPHQLLFNVVEGVAKTVVKDHSSSEITADQEKMLFKLAVGGRLLQSHFSPDETFKLPMDIEWILSKDTIYLLQIRPYDLA